MKDLLWREKGRDNWDEETLTGMRELRRFPVKGVTTPEDRVVIAQIRKLFFENSRAVDSCYFLDLIMTRDSKSTGCLMLGVGCLVRTA